MEMLKKVLNSYSVQPLDIEEVTPRLYRIRDVHQEYALKQSFLSKDSLNDWEAVYHQAFSRHLSSVVPVYLTKQRNLYVEMGESIYYLSPWIESNARFKDRPAIEGFYQSLGMVHAQTKQTLEIDTGKLEASFHTYQTFCEESGKELLAVVEQFEQRHYMSPFELSVCTHYRDLEFSIREISRRTSLLLDELQGEVRWNYSLCHGNPRLSHSLSGSVPYLINWENARYDSPVMDLADFFKQEVRYYDYPMDQLVESFSVYHQENELTTLELQQLTIHMLNPANYMKILRHYVNDPQGSPEVQQVSRLQQAYRQLRFGLQFSRYVEDEYEAIAFDESES
ncbi:phosphotransferase [Lentibacillus sediminis]|uniref:phosphotransferase n=1 Tax=Lentibacillus sediminis TaxID=1940529 RepID=UPI000C1C25EF|nr:phosphotransferase [Lentibacillus sediminis]